MPATGPVILASNHLSFSDSIFTPLIVPRKVTFVAKAEYFTGKGIKGWLTKLFFVGTGTIPVDRSGGQAARAALDTQLQVLRDGGVAGIYPEGTRSPDGRLYRGKTGVARLALESGAVVVPVAMLNADEIQPTGQAHPQDRPGADPLRRAAGLLPLRRAGRRPVRRARGHRRDHVRADGALRPGVRRHLRAEAQAAADARPGSRRPEQAAA